MLSEVKVLTYWSKFPEAPYGLFVTDCSIFLNEVQERQLAINAGGPSDCVWIIPGTLASDPASLVAECNLGTACQ